MKKLLALILALIMILVLAACGGKPAPEAEAAPEPAATAEAAPEAEPAAAETTVDTWYGQARGLGIALALSSDGTYTLTVGNDTGAGTWEELDGGIVLDGDESAPLYKVNGKLMWQGMGLFLSSDEPAFMGYVPAETVSDGVTAETFNGYWTSAYVDADGAALPADELGDKTDVYIEAPRAALGGPLFGDVTLDMAFENGTLTWEAEGVSVVLALQQDGLMRMTLASPDADMVLYLMPTYVEGVFPESGASGE